MFFEVLSTTLLLILTLVILWIVNFSIEIKRLLKKYEHIPGPSPAPGIKGFFLGNIPSILEYDRKGISRNKYFDSLFPIYGKTFKVRFLKEIVIVSIEPNVIKQVYIDENLLKTETMYKFLGYPAGERFIGKGLVTEGNHEVWKGRRALFNPGFHRPVLIQFMKEFNAKANDLIGYLRNKADGKTEVTLIDKFNHTTLDIIASVAFSMELDTVNNPNNKFNEYIFYAISNLRYFFMDPLIKYKPHKWNFLKKHKNAINYLRDTGRNQLLKRLEMIKNNEELPNDILTTILKSHEEQVFDIESMVDDFVTFFVAGQETTATLLASLFLELGREENKDILKKLKNEIDTEIGSKFEISFDDISKLKYTNCCIKEALRLWPPVSGLVRNCSTLIKAENFIIPTDPNARIGTSIYSSARCEDFFENALAFNPERFINADSDKISKYVYYPFSIGPRNCIGQNFAQIEAKVIVVKFLQNFDYKLNPDQSFESVQEGTLRPKDGTKCFITLKN